MNVIAERIRKDGIRKIVVACGVVVAIVIVSIVGLLAMRAPHQPQLPTDSQHRSPPATQAKEAVRANPWPELSAVLVATRQAHLAAESAIKQEIGVEPFIYDPDVQMRSGMLLLTFKALDLSAKDPNANAKIAMAVVTQLKKSPRFAGQAVGFNSVSKPVGPLFTFQVKIE